MNLTAKDATILTLIKQHPQTKLFEALMDRLDDPSLRQRAEQMRIADGSKVLYLIRGLPGSGKSTLARKLAGDHVCEADQFFERQGCYRFDPALLGEAHEACRDKVCLKMAAEISPIAVANTFTRLWEMAPYESHARHYGYRVDIITAPFNGLSNVELQARCVHNIPLQTIMRMRRYWQLVD